MNFIENKFCWVISDCFLIVHISWRQCTSNTMYDPYAIFKRKLVAGLCKSQLFLCFCWIKLEMHCMSCSLKTLVKNLQPKVSAKFHMDEGSPAQGKKVRRQKKEEKTIEKRGEDSWKFWRPEMIVAYGVSCTLGPNLTYSSLKRGPQPCNDFLLISLTPLHTVISAQTGIWYAPVETTFSLTPHEWSTPTESFNLIWVTDQITHKSIQQS